MSDFFRFPHTPHIAWLGRGQPRDDKVLSSIEASEFLDSDVIVEEKIDGANLGFSVGQDGELRAQNRGSYLELDSPAGQWKPIKRWLETRRNVLIQALAPNLMLFGEWCYAVHSVRYDRLPDWFLAFDVFDRDLGVFWSVDRRDEFAKGLGIQVVPELTRGKLGIEALEPLLDHSRLSSGTAEGIYVRKELNGVLAARAKLVRSEFVQAIGEHWSRRHLELNQLDPSVRQW